MGFRIAHRRDRRYFARYGHLVDGHWSWLTDLQRISTAEVASIVFYRVARIPRRMATRDVLRRKVEDIEVARSVEVARLVESMGRGGGFTAKKIAGTYTGIRFLHDHHRRDCRLPDRRPNSQRSSFVERFRRPDVQRLRSMGRIFCSKMMPYESFGTSTLPRRLMPARWSFTSSISNSPW